MCSGLDQKLAQFRSCSAKRADGPARIKHSAAPPRAPTNLDTCSSGYTHFL
ncbi:hypothetical protein A2U01_0113057, partial [Trifolium medium]|nr:hypothetical protein [Trifolium medium]